MNKMSKEKLYTIAISVLTGMILISLFLPYVKNSLVGANVAYIHGHQLLSVCFSSMGYSFNFIWGILFLLLPIVTMAISAIFAYVKESKGYLYTMIASNITFWLYVIVILIFVIKRDSIVTIIQMFVDYKLSVSFGIILIFLCEIAAIVITYLAQKERKMLGTVRRDVGAIGNAGSTGNIGNTGAFRQNGNAGVMNAGMTDYAEPGGYSEPGSFTEPAAFAGNSGFGVSSFSGGQEFGFQAGAQDNQGFGALSEFERQGYTPAPGFGGSQAYAAEPGYGENQGYASEPGYGGSQGYAAASEFTGMQGFASPEENVFPSTPAFPEVTEDSVTVAAPRAKAVLVGKIIGLGGLYVGAEIALNGNEEIIIGRDSAVSNLIIVQGDISRKHCSIRFDSGRNEYAVTDFSTNGTYLEDGAAIPKNTTVYYPKGTVIRLDDTNIFRLF